MWDSRLSRLSALQDMTLLPSTTQHLSYQMIMIWPLTRIFKTKLSSGVGWAYFILISYFDYNDSAIAPPPPPIPPPCFSLMTGYIPTPQTKLIFPNSLSIFHLRAALDSFISSQKCLRSARHLPSQSCFHVKTILIIRTLKFSNLLQRQSSL